nr:SpoIID/LytB domain-containing protein [Paenibacillus lemnae]
MAEQKIQSNSTNLNSDAVQPLSATNPTNALTLYITSTGTLKTLGFDAYAKDVLPNEWYASWKPEALKAGAVAIKSYAWYNVTYPRYPATSYGAHLTDKWENYQHYVPGSSHANTNAAVDSVSGIFMKNSNGVVFDTQYRAGTSGQAGTEGSGVLSQHGTQYLATNYSSWNYKAILGYYYNFSNKSNGYIQFTGSGSNPGPYSTNN